MASMEDTDQKRLKCWPVKYKPFILIYFISPSLSFPLLQSNIERKPFEEMLAAEEANQFTYKAGTTTNNEAEVAPTEVLTNRLQDLDISKVIPSSWTTTIWTLISNSTKR